MKQRLSLFLFLFYTALNAQEPAHYIVGKEIFNGVHLYSVIQDKDNSVWLTSNKGLYNYNGVSFTHQVPKNTKSTSLFGLTKNNKGNIFCLNLSGEIYEIVNKKLQLYYTVPSAYLSGGMRMVFDKNNNLYVITFNGTLIISEKKEIKKLKNKTNVFTQKKDTAYFGNITLNNKRISLGNFNKKGLFKADSLFCDRLYPRHFFVNDKIYCFDKTNHIFFNIQKYSKEKVNLPFLVNKYYEVYSSANDFWFCNYKNGVYRVPHKNINKHLNPTKWFPNYYISGVMTDFEGNTWLLTFNKGIIIIPNLKITYQQELKGTDLKAIQKSNNQLYVSSTNGIIYTLKDNKFTTYLKTHNDRVEHFNIFKNKNIIVTNLGIYKNKRILKEILFTRSSLITNNTVYLAMFNGLGYYNLETKEFKKLTNSRTYDVYFNDVTKKIWIASSIGLTHFKNGKETPIKYKGKSLLVNKFTKVNQHVWASSTKGIYIFKNDSVTEHLTTKKGLLSNKVYKIIYKSPYVYISSQKGLQQYNTVTKTFKNFTLPKGIARNIISFEVLNSTIYIANSNGLLSFSFRHINDSIPMYQTEITNAEVNGNTILTNNSILKPNENDIEFSFLTKSFRYQKEITYQYQLKGYEKKPTIVKENQYFVKYPNLPAGTYTFKVDSFTYKKKNKSAYLTFTIKNYWYNTLWFKVLVIVLVLCMLYYIYKTRVNFILRKRDKEIMEKRLAESSLTSLKAQMNPHFMFNAMNSIQALILEGNKYEAYEYLAQLSDFVRRNLLMSDVTYITLKSELLFVEKYLELEHLRFKDTFTFTIQSSIEGEQLLIPSMIIQPFLENAIKHGLLHKKKDRKLTVEFTEENNTITCCITDNGIGREASKIINKSNLKEESFSTNAIQKRFNILKEYYKLDIGFTYEDLKKKNKPIGTKVLIKIPYKKDD